jgi:hypothetical protein
LYRFHRSFGWLPTKQAAGVHPKWSASMSMMLKSAIPFSGAVEVFERLLNIVPPENIQTKCEPCNDNRKRWAAPNLKLVV